MTKLLTTLPLLLAIALTGCGQKPDDKYAVIKKACLAEGDDAIYCDCYIDALEKNVSDSVAERIAKGIKDEGKTRIEAEDSLPASDLKKIQTLFPVVWNCVSAE